MRKKRFKIRLRPAHLLAVLFLFYIFYVGSAALPKFLAQTVSSLQQREGLRTIIRQTDEQYSSMLEAQVKLPALHDKGSYINLNGFMAKTLRQTEINERVLLKNSLLASVSAEAPREEDLRQAAENLTAFCRAHQENGGDFLFVMAPSKISKFEDVLPVGYTDTENETADRFLAMLEGSGVPVLDLRETLKENGILWEDAFFTTDHHWTPQTGFLAYREMVKTLTEMGAAEAVDPFYTDVRNYTFHTMEDTFLGSSGRRTGICFAGIDDSVFLVPDFPTELLLSVPSQFLEVRGSYQEVSYTPSDTDFAHPDYYNENMYGLYGRGDTALSRWRNDSACVEERILMIGDSFANVPFSLMSICYSSCDEMDMRYFKENFPAYYQDYRPETVVFLLCPANCVSEFTFHPFLSEGQ